MKFGTFLFGGFEAFSQIFGMLGCLTSVFRGVAPTSQVAWEGKDRGPTTSHADPGRPMPAVSKHLREPILTSRGSQPMALKFLMSHGVWGVSPVMFGAFWRPDPVVCSPCFPGFPASVTQDHVLLHYPRYSCRCSPAARAAAS